MLARWQPRHLAPLARLHADPEVMATLGAPLTRTQSDGFAEHQEAGFARAGYAMWAVERAADGQFVGAVGLSPVTFAVPFAPTVDVGWRLDRAHWGRGYATEAARAALDYGFDVAGREEIVSFTSVGNVRSTAVMERLGLARQRQGFEHPNVAPGDPLRPHVLFRIDRAGWAARRS